MPELPEVEATKRYLVSEGIVGRELTGAAMSWPGAVRSGPVEDFVLGLTGRTIRDVGRRGKYITMALEAHVGAPAATLLPAYVRAALHLDDGREVRFRDPRKLGHLRLTEEAASVLGRPGPRAAG